METQGINIQIVDDNKLTMLALKLYLENRFGKILNISTYHDGESCLKNVDHQTKIVILDYFMDGKNGLDVLKTIKAISPKTEVIMLTNNEDIAIAIETFRAGAKDYIVKGDGSWKKITRLIDNFIARPIKVIVKGFLK